MSSAGTYTAWTMSSAGTYTAWTDVIAAPATEAIRSSSPEVIGQDRLITDLRGEPAEQSRDLRADLNVPEDVVDQEHHLGLLHVAEVLGHRQGGESDAEPSTLRLAHLAEDQDGVGDAARLLHLMPEVVALPGPLADSREARDPGSLLIERPDELLKEHGLADAGPPMRPALPPAAMARADR